ncbi:MAG: hypothetical protein C4541_07825 [Candidatus Auribacter fodinae]|uniref:Type II secretion system protein n=1 Tax=Candidatus Auribacter fodinae TaxID=2093366 RepID=A0A3A4QXB4_9BACT|nr:MAG: hypothetical protein C4541_07825 [Candidatus Auribacter fodinae]
MPYMKQKRKESGMTLNELLVVVSLVIVLMYLATAGLKMAYVKVEKVQCANNLHQIGMAIQLYAGDHDMFLPTPGRLGGNTWRRKLIEGAYIDDEKLFSCPALPAECNYRLNSGHNDGTGWEHADGGDGGASDMSAIEKPGETLLLSEYQNTLMTTDVDSNGSETYTDTTMWSGNYPTQSTHSLLQVHNGGSNYLFADFHVEWISKEDMQNDPNNYSYYKKP